MIEDLIKNDTITLHMLEIFLGSRVDNFASMLVLTTVYNGQETVLGKKPSKKKKEQIWQLWIPRIYGI